MANYLNFTKAIFNPYNPKVINEGQFSWMTYDTDKQIGSEKQNTINVYMYDNEGNQWFEKKYDGYGEFGGMDYYALLAKMNGYSDEDLEDAKVLKSIRAMGKAEMRDIGIALAFGKIKTKIKGGKVLFPALVEDPKFNWKRHDFTKEAESDENQSWYQEPEYDEDEDDDYESGWYESLKTNEGAMSEIHIMAKEAKDEEDFKKKFYKEYGAKIKKSSETDEWIKDLYVDSTNEAVGLTWDSLKESLGLNEAKFNKKSLMKAMKADDGMVQLGNGKEYVIYAYDNGNDDNDDMWGDKTIFGLDQDGEEHEIEYSDIVSYNESTVNEGRSINKISKDLEKTVLGMKKTVDAWKESEGDRKSELLEKLRELNKEKVELEKELNDAVAGKDHDLQLALTEAEELAYLELDVTNILND
jgi:hypothetical protein